MPVVEPSQAVLLDAMGTLLTFEPPAPLLRAELRKRGVDVSAAAAEAAIRDEIAYYRAHLHEGRDGPSLADLRHRAAEAMRPALGVDGDLTEALLASLRFHAYPDAQPALLALRSRGLAIVVVSNWDHSLHQRLSETGLAPLVDAAVASAELGHAKPDRAIFEHALELAGVDAGAALHAGDSPREDVEGALAAGLRAVLVARGGRAPAADLRAVPGARGGRAPAADLRAVPVARGGRPPAAAVPVIRSLAELPQYA